MVNSGVEPSSKPLPVSLIEAVVADIDIVVVMLVKPGWGGKKYLSQANSKIKQIHELAEIPHISVDGGVSTSNSAFLLEAGANVFFGVAGGRCFPPRTKGKLSLHSFIPTMCQTL